ncbi:polysaccharide pyruvyl transferase [Gottschalkia acidurici 9a]|uniref:Polysaccharide pyruvyl transferase n=1 Tax=Gottschalkia acidurici (strain ATCC 7906 / DSM 604 / BCRC 14475 / CIP 104303 / KCTC 5404 / NCIMB 10678 / 9a) TaxID=1128398 RepID=K0B1T8_GOTA9|nr:polysaccharide pyruvyl transferase CsaB [Gottschalkia acidurici]AFS79082.1 polysaccharide pyruvyl transferase [Gottschalkia acidurici 9a]
MNKIVISGYYGFNNIGDESILTAIISNLKDNIDDIDITVLSKNPELTYNKHNVNAIDRKNIFQIIKEIRKCDILISGGGSLLQDVTSARNVIYYLSIMIIGILFRKKVMIYSQGIGPINRPINRYLTKIVLNKVDVITLRDHKSEKILREINIKNKNINVTADPVIGLKKRDTKLGREMLVKSGMKDTNKPIIGFAIRGRDRDQNLIDVMSSVSDKIIDEMGVNVVFIPFHYGEDMKVLSEIEQNMKNKAIFLKGKYDINEMLSIIGNLDLLIGIRLHSLIFGAVMNIPMIAVSYDPKINNFMEYLDEDVFCNVSELDEDSLVSEIRDKISHEEEYKRKLYDKVEYLKERLHQNEEIISKLLKKSKK